VPHELEVALLQEMRDIPLPAREIIVETDDIVPLVHEPLAEMRAEKSGSAGNQYA
jgi:hypothetical protein